MKISFYWRTNKVFDPENIQITPFGGAEISSLNLANQFAERGIDTTIYCGSLGNYDDGNLHIRRYADVRNDEHDIFINVRLDPIISKRFPQFKHQPRKIVVWSGDAYDQSNNSYLHDPMLRDSFDAFVCKSDWQLNTLKDHFYYADWWDKLTRLYNGVNLEYYDDQDHNHNKFIHASVIFRGADKLLRIWPVIKSELGDVELDIFTSLKLYTGDARSDAQYTPLLKQLHGMPGVNMLEPINQRELARKLCTSGMMLYPNTFMESSCGVALESMAAGCPVITTNMAGLAETVSMIGGGVLIDNNEDYDVNFVRRTLELWHNKEEVEKLRRQSQETIKEHSWTLVADRWLDFLKSL